MGTDNLYLEESIMGKRTIELTHDEFELINEALQFTGIEYHSLLKRLRTIKPGDNGGDLAQRAKLCFDLAYNISNGERDV